MDKNNLDMIRKLKSENVSTDLIDEVLKVPKDHREEIAKEAIVLSKKKLTDMGQREALRMYKKRLIVNTQIADLHPTFFNAIYAKIEALTLVCSKELLKKMNDKQRIELKARFAKLHKFIELLNG